MMNRAHGADWVQQSLNRLQSLFHRTRLDREVDAELEAHLNLAIEENLGRGMDAEKARRQALISLGGVAQAREHHREARGLPALDTFWQDMRYALRGIIKTPGFTLAAVLTLGLGIAINATMFSMVSGFLLQPPPGRQPGRVAVITSINPTQRFQPDTNLVSAPNYLAWRAHNDVFERMAAANEFLNVSLTWQGQTEAYRAAAVSPDYFNVLGVSAMQGRVFYQGDDQPGRDHVVILSHELWDRKFGSDPSIVGGILRINREDYAVIGIMPASFRLMGFVPQLWMPLVLSGADQTAVARKDRALLLLARMKPSVTLPQARAELKTLGRNAEKDFPDTETGWGVQARTLPDFLIYTFGIRNALVVAMAVVGFVLLIACANVAGLLLARAGARRKELAIRMSLGASRLRIIRQLLTEGLLLAVLGGGIGLLLAYWGIHFVRMNMGFNPVVRAVPMEMDWNVLWYALTVSLISAVLCSLAPAFSASKTDINAHLKDEGRAASSGRSRSRLRSLLVTGEVAAAVFLLIGTGLLLRTMYLIMNRDLGFQPSHLLTARVTLDKARYTDAGAQSLFVRDLLPRLRQLPGAEAVAVGSDLPANNGGSTSFQIKGGPELPGGQRPTAVDIVVSSNFFQTAGIPLLHGRTFTERDESSAPRVVVVNQEVVHRYFKDQDPLGKEVRLDVIGGEGEWCEIVGVVGNVKNIFMDPVDDAQIYEPFLQRPVPSFALMIRSSADPQSLSSAMRQAVAHSDLELPVARLMTMDAVFEEQTGGNKFFLNTLASFALMALLLSAIGIYGLISYSVGQRTHEIAIRMALGASGWSMGRMVLREGVKMALIGGVIGLAMATPLPAAFNAMFDGIQTKGFYIYALVPVAILIVALVATYIPARRAAAIDPIKALHSN